MSAPRSGQDSRRSSKSGRSGNDAKGESERREKAQSSQLYGSQRYEGKRRASRQEGGSNLVMRPEMKTRTNSAPTIDTRRQTAASHQEATKGGAEKEHHLPPPVEDGQDEDEVAGVVGAVKQLQPFRNPEISEPVPNINIAVIGAEGVGKSLFVQNALDLPFPPASHSAERIIAMHGTDYLLRLLEVPLDDIEIDEDDETVEWPDTIEEKMMPKIDGALALYDVNDGESLDNIPEILRAIDKSGIPLVLVSNKCDSRPEERQIDPAVVEKKAKRQIKSLNTIQTSSQNFGGNKRCMSMILRAIMSEAKDEKPQGSPNRKRAASTAVRPVSPHLPVERGHLRASSEYTGSLYREQRHSRHDSSGVQYGQSDKLKVPSDSTLTPSDDMHRSFLFEESGSEASTESSRSSTEAIQHAIHAAHQTSTEEGMTFDELVDQLLAQPSSKADEKFVAIFLALYRKFAAPGRLLEAIVDRFHSLNQEGEGDIIKTATQLRYLTVMEKWVGTYPGDFAYPKTKRRMQTFIGKLSQRSILGASAKEMQSDLEGVREDDDTSWAYNDKDRASTDTEFRISHSTTASTLIDDPTFLTPDDTTLTPASTRDDSSMFTTSDINRILESAQKQAQLLAPIPRQAVSKVHWHELMNCPDDLLARELTRMDWIMFSSIRPRDLVRHVSLNDKQKANCKNLVYVNRMIEHFNHLALWVENYILLRDKPKHRALMMEKFMRVTRKLRELNNYNALGAIIAGIKSSSVHRLVATRELIPPELGKDWMKWEILMGQSRSHFTYRLAWENSNSARIPYLPLHLRDLLSAEEGNKTFINDDPDGKINWNKFEVIGEVIIGMQKAQEVPYKILGTGRGTEQIKELILDVKLEKDEDNLFQRSKMVEPTGTTTSNSTTKFKEFFKR